MRFDDEDYLRMWKQERVFPAIHDALFNEVAAECLSKNVLDLCCSTGLLGQRLKNICGFNVWGVDADEKALRLALKYAIDIPLTTMSLDVSRPDSHGQLSAFIRKHGITCVVARRCFPELFTNADKSAIGSFVNMLSYSGVREVFLEGRVKSERSVHPVADVHAEVKILEQSFQRIFIRGGVAYLATKGVWSC